MKKVGKTTRPFRYDLNQIPYDYTVEVRNIFKGLDLTDRVPEELWMEVCDIVQETGIKTVPKKRNAKVGSQEIPGVTGKFSLGVQNEAGQRLTVFPREHNGHSKRPLPTTQEKTLHMDITRWSIPKSD